MIGPDLTVKWSTGAASPLEIPGANLIFDALEAQPSCRARRRRPREDHVRGDGARS